jgi:hypothetical protein
MQKSLLVRRKVAHVRVVAFALHDTDRVSGFKQGRVGAPVGMGDTLMNAGQPRLAALARLDLAVEIVAIPRYPI